MVVKVFDELGPRYATRNGGYLRILKCGFRSVTMRRWPLSSCSIGRNPQRTRLRPGADHRRQYVGVNKARPSLAFLLLTVGGQSS
jgi:hypothetical protein